MAKKNAGKTKETGRKRTKKVKKEGPKKPLSGFMYFSQERRKTLKEEQPDLKITEASVVIGADWKKLTDDEKEPYNKLAKEDKKRYEKEKEKADLSVSAKGKAIKDDDLEDEEDKESEDDDDD